MGNLVLRGGDDLAVGAPVPGPDCSSARFISGKGGYHSSGRMSSRLLALHCVMMGKQDIVFLQPCFRALADYPMAFLQVRESVG